MPKKDKYHIDYANLYPEYADRKDLFSILKKSDRKMEYMEVDLKQGHFKYDPKLKDYLFCPAREDSYERLQDVEQKQFAQNGPTPEEAVIRAEEITRLQSAIKNLTPDERDLINALFFCDMTERAYAKQIGLSQKGVNKRWHKIRKKLFYMLTGKESC